jgi:ADP-heptose:LPS heptosyltransferase
MRQKIILRRAGALGDVLCATPIARRLRQLNPAAEIVGQTNVPEALAENIWIDRVIPMNQREPDAELIDLDLAYERRPTMHIVDAYMEAAGIDGDKTPCFGRFHPTGTTHKIEFIAIHAARAWPSRTFSPAFWDTVITVLLHKFSYPIVLVGHGGDYRVAHDRVINMVGRLTLAETRLMIETAGLLVCNDSGMLHLAGTTRAAIVGLFTSVKAAYRLPYRDGVLGWNCAAIEAPIGCYGCLAEAPVPSTNLVCRRGDNACVTSIEPAAVVDQVATFVAGNAM